MNPGLPYTMYCPRCDKRFSASSVLLVEKAVSAHVDRAHTDYVNPFKED